MPTIKVNENTHKRLVQVKGQLEAKDGKRRTMEDTIKELIDRFEIRR